MTGTTCYCDYCECADKLRARVAELEGAARAAVYGFVETEFWDSMEEDMQRLQAVLGATASAGEEKGDQHGERASIGDHEAGQGDSRIASTRAGDEAPEADPAKVGREALAGGHSEGTSGLPMGGDAGAPDALDSSAAGLQGRAMVGRPTLPDPGRRLDPRTSEARIAKPDAKCSACGKDYVWWAGHTCEQQRTTDACSASGQRSKSPCVLSAGHEGPHVLGGMLNTSTLPKPGPCTDYPLPDEEAASRAGWDAAIDRALEIIEWEHYPREMHKQIAALRLRDDKATFTSVLESDLDRVKTLLGLDPTTHGIAHVVRALEERSETPVPEPKRCPVCSGSGNVWLGPPGNKYRADCYECKGKGEPTGGTEHG